MKKDEAFKSLMKKTDEIVSVSNKIIKTGALPPIDDLPKSIQAVIKKDVKKIEEIDKNSNLIFKTLGITGAVTVAGAIGTGVIGTTTVLGFVSAPMTMGLSLVPSFIGFTVSAAGVIYFFKKREEIIPRKESIKKNKADLYKIYAAKSQQLKFFMEKNAVLFKQNSSALKEELKKCAILIDDAKHVDVNKRIQKYDAAILKQYEIQVKLHKDYEEISEKYNKLQLDYNKLLEEMENLQVFIAEVERYDGVFDSIIKSFKKEKN